jgi:hypothetical protein
MRGEVCFLWGFSLLSRMIDCSIASQRNSFFNRSSIIMSRCFLKRENRKKSDNTVSLFLDIMHITATPSKIAKLSKTTSTQPDPPCPAGLLPPVVFFYDLPGDKWVHLGAELRGRPHFGAGWPSGSCRAVVACTMGFSSLVRYSRRKHCKGRQSSKYTQTETWP